MDRSRFADFDLELQIPEAIRNAKVVDLTDASSSWNWNMLNNWLPSEVLVKKIQPIPPPEDIVGTYICLGEGRDAKCFFCVCHGIR